MGRRRAAPKRAGRTPVSRLEAPARSSQGRLVERTIANENAHPMYAIAIVRYRQPVEEVLKAQELHRAYLRQLKEDGTLVAAGPMDPRFGGMFLLRVPDDNPRAALDAVRDNDPYYHAGVAQYELNAWNVVIGKEDLDRI
jgi:uncharacterized protein YciI